MPGKRKKNILVNSDEEAMKVCDMALDLSDEEYLELVEGCTSEEGGLHKILTGEEAPKIHTNFKSAKPSMLELLYKIKFREKYLDSKGENL